MLKSMMNTVHFNLDISISTLGCFIRINKQHGFLHPPMVLAVVVFYGQLLRDLSSSMEVSGISLVVLRSLLNIIKGIVRHFGKCADSLSCSLRLED